MISSASFGSHAKVIDSLVGENLGKLATTNSLDTKALLSLISLEVKRRLRCFWSTTLWNEKSHRVSHSTDKTFFLKL